jgi:hypothetical protein
MSDWKIRALHIEDCHKVCKERDSKWSIRKTAKLLKMSVGIVSEDIRLAKLLRGSAYINKLQTRKDAIDFMRGAYEQVHTRRR